jgi:hypothetical protein
MRATLESIEKNQATIHVEVEEEKVAEAFDQAYRKVVKKVLIPGFRKGKTPRPILEARLGKEVLYEEALEILLAEAYEESPFPQAAHGSHDPLKGTFAAAGIGLFFPPLQTDGIRSGINNDNGSGKPSP